MLVPVPIVVDANVLLRNVEFASKHGHAGALFTHASGDYSQWTGIVLFAAAEVGDEIERHLPRFAHARGLDLGHARETLNKLILPYVRFVELDGTNLDDPRIDAVRKLDPDDEHTAALVSLLAPAILMTDNRRHFAPYALKAFNDTTVEPIAISNRAAIDLRKMGEVELGMRGVVMLPTVTGAVTIEGSKKLIGKLGPDWTAVIGLLLLGGAVLFLTSDRGRDVRARARDLAREAGPPLMRMMEEYAAATDRAGALAVEPAGARDAMALVARRMAIGRPVMKTRDIADMLRSEGYSFDSKRKFETETRAWLVRTPCFVEHQTGTWTLGYHLRELTPS
jgi:hypothetical protein